MTSIHAAIGANTKLFETDTNVTADQIGREIFKLGRGQRRKIMEHILIDADE